jgi:hypothetical protein
LVQGGENHGIKMRDLPDEGESRKESQGTHEQDLEMAHYLVPGMEGLSEGTG